MSKLSKKEQGKRNQRIGNAGEEFVANALSGRGLDMVEKVGTPVRLIPVEDRARLALNRKGVRTSDLFHVKFGEKVSGDRRAIIGGMGISVLIEVKTRLTSKLSVSDFEAHQLPALEEHDRLGGLSLIAWVHESGVYVMRAPIPGFEKYKPLSPERAAGLDIIDLVAYSKCIVRDPSIESLTAPGGNTCQDNTADWLMLTGDIAPENIAAVKSFMAKCRGIASPIASHKTDVIVKERPSPIAVNFVMRDIFDALNIENPNVELQLALYDVAEKLLLVTPEVVDRL